MLNIISKNNKFLSLDHAINFPNFVKINEIGPCYGLQKTTNYVNTNYKINMINRLSHTGLKSIDVTNFVSYKKILQIKDHEEVYNSFKKLPSIRYNNIISNTW